MVVEREKKTHTRKKNVHLAKKEVPVFFLEVMEKKLMNMLNK